MHLAGILARDPEIRCTPGGKTVANFVVATTFEKYTEYHRCVAWEECAGKLATRFKGDYIRLCGRLQSRSWDDKQSGQKRYITEVVAWNIDNGEQVGVPKPAAPKPPEPPKPKKSEPPFVNAHGVTVSDDDVPF